MSEIAILNIDDVAKRLRGLANDYRVGLLVDETTMELCYPLVGCDEIELLVVPEGEGCKTLEVAKSLWDSLLEMGYSRKDYLVTLGGGAVSDIGGFVASTYMRGMRLVHIPTTLLGMIDASIGGKTAIDFGGGKNIVGTYYTPDSVWVSLDFLDTLPQSEISSGLGELYKYGLLIGEECLHDILDLDEFTSTLIGRVMQYKLDTVSDDLYDKNGQRACLNLGHTSAHAFEALYFNRDTSIAHGHAVAAGIVVALYISYKWGTLDERILTTVARSVKRNFPTVFFTCDDYDKLWELALKDKKRVEDNYLTMILLKSIGNPISNSVSREQWEEALDFYRDFMG